MTAPRLQRLEPQPLVQTPRRVLRRDAERDGGEAVRCFLKQFLHQGRPHAFPSVLRQNRDGQLRRLFIYVSEAFINTPRQTTPRGPDRNATDELYRHETQVALAPPPLDVPRKFRPPQN